MVLVIVASGTVGLLRAESPAATAAPAGPEADEVDAQVPNRPLDQLVDEVGLGAALYARDCVYCHGPEGGGGARGPSLAASGEAGAHFWLTTGYMPIQNVNEPIGRSPTPYSDEELVALIDHVAAFGDGPPLPDLEVAEADVAAGGELYRLHCAPCHSATGIGGALAFDEFAPDLFATTPMQTVTAMVNGPGAMPAFPPGAFDDDEIAAIAAYVDYLQGPADPGGLPLLRAGRVDEGVVAWAVGVTTLVLLSVWIGRRAREDG
jgi:ubiquinol-cytochrome c reductase cytochrome c subunit